MCDLWTQQLQLLMSDMFMLFSQVDGPLGIVLWPRLPLGSVRTLRAHKAVGCHISMLQERLTLNTESKCVSAISELEGNKGA